MKSKWAKASFNSNEYFRGGRPLGHGFDGPFFGALGALGAGSVFDLRILAASPGQQADRGGQSHGQQDPEDEQIATEAVGLVEGHAIGVVRRQAFDGRVDAGADGVDLGRDDEATGQAHEQGHHQAAAPEADGTDDLVLDFGGPTARPAEPGEPEDDPGGPVQALDDQASEAHPGLEDIKRWLRELIPGAPAPRTLEAWELPEPVPMP